MRNAQWFFRYVWRANAVLIFVAMSVVCFLTVSTLAPGPGRGGDRGRAEAAPITVARKPAERLVVAGVGQVRGTNVLRGELVARGEDKGFSSSGSAFVKRNILFFDGAEKSARWLLPDSQHVLTRVLDVPAEDEPGSPRPVATVILAKPVSASGANDGGALLIADPTGRSVLRVADDVTDVDHAGMSTDGLVTVLYERGRKYVMASFNATSLALVSRSEVAVPDLK